MPTNLTGRTIPTTISTGRTPITSGDTYILTELSGILTTESGLPIIFEYGVGGTPYIGRVIP